MSRDTQTILGRIGTIMMIISLSLFFITVLSVFVFNNYLDLTVLAGIIFVISLPFLALGGLIQFNQTSSDDTISNNSHKTDEILKKQLEEQKDFNEYQSYLAQWQKRYDGYYHRKDRLLKDPGSNPKSYEEWKKYR